MASSESLEIQAAQAAFEAYQQGIQQHQGSQLQASQTDFASLNPTQRMIWRQVAQSVLRIYQGQQQGQQQGQNLGGDEQAMTGAGRG